MIQMSLELEAQLRDLADREYAGQLQVLVRQCLLSRVAEDECKQDVPDVAQSLEQLRQDLLDVMARVEHTVDILSTGMVSLPTNMNNLDRELAAHTEVLEKLRGTPDAVSSYPDTRVSRPAPGPANPGARAAYQGSRAA